MTDHEHRYFPFENKAAFEPIAGSALYERIEYVIMTCNCGDVIKIKVKNGGEDE